MRLILKAPWLLILLIVSGLSGTELYQRYSGALILDQPLDQTAHELRASGRPGEAAMLVEFVQQHPASGNMKNAKTLAAELESERGDYAARARRFAQGAVSGEPTDTDSLLGSLSLDLFVIGDIRDLAVQGWKEVRYDNGDEFIMALSAVGLATTLAPEVDWAPALMKAFKRMGALSEAFVASFKSMMKQAMKTRKAGPAVDVLADFGKAAKRLGPGPMSNVMKHVESTADLTKISKAAELDATGTYVVATRFGKDGIKRIGANGSNIGKLAGSVKTVGRIGKIGKKSLGIVPTPWLVALLIGGIGLIFRLIWPRRGKVFHQAISPPAQRS